MNRHAEGLRLGTMRFLMTLHWTDTTWIVVRFQRVKTSADGYDGDAGMC